MCSRYRYSNYYVFMVETVKSDVILLALAFVMNLILFGPDPPVQVVLLL